MAVPGRGIPILMEPVQECADVAAEAPDAVTDSEAVAATASECAPVIVPSMPRHALMGGRESQQSLFDDLSPL